MSKLIAVYLFHLILVFPYLAYLAYQLDQPNQTPALQQHGQLLKFVVFVGAVYQLILLARYVKMIYY